MPDDEIRKGEFRAYEVEATPEGSEVRTHLFSTEEARQAWADEDPSRRYFDPPAISQKHSAREAELLAAALDSLERLRLACAAYDDEPGADE